MSLSVSKEKIQHKMMVTVKNSLSAEFLCDVCCMCLPPVCGQFIYAMDVAEFSAFVVI